MKAIRTVLACLRKADQKYNLINHGDKIVVGLSGGKDSMALCYALSLYQKFSHTNFIIQPVTLDLGFPGFDSKPLEEFCENIGLKLIVHDARDVYKILSIQQKDHNHLPCSICSRMKKAAINKVAIELGYNKVAFAHHADDAIETLFMNEIYGGRVATFSPKMKLERANITFIRPLILVREKEIISLMKEEGLIAIPSHCPSDKVTTREDIKELLKTINKKYPTSKENFLTMLDNYERHDLWEKDIALQVSQDNLSLVPITSPNQYVDYINIRTNVFTNEFDIPFKYEFVVEEEKCAKGFLIIKDDQPIGTIRYIEKENEIQIGRFAILKKYRGKGLGKQSLIYFAHYLWGIYNPKTIYLNAMVSAQKFYEKCGFIKTGRKFKEANIDHVKMIYKEK
ncbi:MAG: GNAT family N-acetyltransferase [Bacilli bacterium]|nr:GNAT family N-acetyltransferase [Bacilli bacterium]